MLDRWEVPGALGVKSWATGGALRGMRQWLKLPNGTEVFQYFNTWLSSNSTFGQLSSVYPPPLFYHWLYSSCWNFLHSLQSKDTLSSPAPTHPSGPNSRFPFSGKPSLLTSGATSLPFHPPVEQCLFPPCFISDSMCVSGFAQHYVPST